MAHYLRHSFAKVNGRSVQQCQACGLLKEDTGRGELFDYNQDRWQYRDPVSRKIVPRTNRCPGRSNIIK